ncbi:MAG: hypothetical protein RL220_1747, partial [Bacteroidota bacterium]
NAIIISASEDVPVNPELYKDLPANIRNRIRPGRNENYKMVINQDIILIQAPSEAGGFYALQTLRQLMPVQSETGKQNLPIRIPSAFIDDRPAFSHRGMLLDCCRHFMDKEFVKRYIDLLAMHKMNVLHWHLTEDQGWRIEIKQYPELTNVGAWRTEKDGTRYGGFYTQDDIREIVRYAAERHITIIPEIEMPGHSVAAIASYPYLSCTGENIPVENEWGVFKDIYCAGKESTFEFIENVLDEVCELFPSQYIHIGGDESPRVRWENCEHCQKRMKEHKLKDEADLHAYFNERIGKYLASKGRILIGWDEILEGGIPANGVIQSWQGEKGAIDAVRLNHYAIMSPTSHCYFDYPLESTDLREVYSFDPVPAAIADDRINMILGAECNMWTEHAPQELVDNRMFPRMLAFSEVVWRYPATRDYNSFYQRVNGHLDRLDKLGVKYGLPAVASAISCQTGDDGTLEVFPKPLLDDAVLKYRIRYGNADFLPWQDIDSVITIAEDAELEIQAQWRSLEPETPLYRRIVLHKGFSRPLTLSYAINTSYPGGGQQALCDGLLGTDSFRDGLWQAVFGDNLQATVDLGTVQEINSVSTRWYHYANAWIFRPEKVSLEVSDDGRKWKPWKEIQAPLSADHDSQGAVEYSASGQPISARYIRITGHSLGKCPEWHDAAGSPSWLFADEFVIR